MWDIENENMEMMELRYRRKMIFFVAVIYSVITGITRLALYSGGECSFEKSTGSFTAADTITGILAYADATSAGTVPASTPVRTSVAVTPAVGDSVGETQPDIEPPAVNAMAAVIVEESTGRILYDKNALKRRSIASTTKIMTALVTLENANVEDEVVISKRAASIGGRSRPEDGRQVCAEELLYALLLVSAMTQPLR